MTAVRLALGQERQERHDGGGGCDTAGEAADLAAFLGRLVRWDKAAVVRLRSARDEPALGVFGHPPFGGVLAVRSVALHGSAAVADAVDATVSAGQLLEAVSAAAGDSNCRRPSPVPPGPGCCRRAADGAGRRSSTRGRSARRRPRL